MGARTKARKRALDILFESEQRGLAPGATLPDRVAEAGPPLNPYTVTLVEGVVAHLPEIDALITSYATGWSIDRMPAVDRTLLRLAIFEMRYVDEVPPAVAISEAVSLAKQLSTDESPSFVNGLLAKVASIEPYGEPPPPGTESPAEARRQSDVTLHHDDEDADITL